VGTAPLTSVFFQEANQDHTDAKIGANWNASSQFSSGPKFSGRITKMS